MNPEDHAKRAADFMRAQKRTRRTRVPILIATAGVFLAVLPQIFRDGDWRLVLVTAVLTVIAIRGSYVVYAGYRRRRFRRANPRVLAHTFAYLERDMEQESREAGDLAICRDGSISFFPKSSAEPLRIARSEISQVVYAGKVDVVIARSAILDVLLSDDAAHLWWLIEPPRSFENALRKLDIRTISI